MRYEVFISHSHQNKKIVLDICKALEKSGIGCFASSRGDIPIGSVFTDVIKEAVFMCRVYLIVLSKESVVSYWVMNKGVMSWIRELNKHVIVFRIDDTEYPEWFEFVLYGCRLVSIDGCSEYKSKLVELVNSIKEIVYTMQ